jgi:tRNA nucleotidyltransferase (CCA-adding enzyme)
MMSLKFVTKLTTDPVTCFATLCHDLGKGETPKNEWPSHKGHEERGIQVIAEFCDRYRVPHEYRELAILVSRFHLHCHKAFELRPNTLLHTLERLDVFRQPERFEKFLLACEADAKGRTGRETIDYPEANRMREAYRIAKAVEIKPLIDQGFEGAALGAKLHQARVSALEEAFR